MPENNLKFLPLGCPLLVVNLGISYSIDNRDPQKIVKEKEVLILGQQDSHYFLSPGSELNVFLVVFEPTGIYRLFGMPIHEFTNNTLQTDEIPEKDLKLLMQMITDCSFSIGNMISTCNIFFTGILHRVRTDHLYIDNAIERIILQRGAVLINDICRDMDINERTFRRRFLETTGISPKKFINIQRFHYILQLMKSPSSVDWQDIIYKCGYFDQMHLIKEFKKFCGETPVSYFSSGDFKPDPFLKQIIDTAFR